MPYKLRIESIGVVITFHGSVRGDEIFALNEQLIGNESFTQWRYQIWDFSNIEGIKISLDELRSFAFQDSIAVHKNPDQRVAIITRNPSKSGLDSIFHLLEEEWGGYESRTFYDVDAARNWANSR